MTLQNISEPARAGRKCVILVCLCYGMILEVYIISVAIILVRLIIVAQYIHANNKQTTVGDPKLKHLIIFSFSFVFFLCVCGSLFAFKTVSSCLKTFPFVNYLVGFAPMVYVRPWTATGFRFFFFH